MEPLAHRVRPKEMDNFVFTSENIVLKDYINNSNIFSMLFWGPPGTGKTTLAKIISNVLDLNFIELSAVTSGVKDLREHVEKARNLFLLSRVKTILFVDEIHRFNKMQQDYLLPHVEKGTVTLIGATTENPAFEVNNALLSRVKVFKFEKIPPLEIKKYLLNVCQNEKIEIKEEIIDFICTISDGDLRKSLNSLEFLSKKENLTLEEAKKLLNKNVFYDQEWHYNTISALHKSLRDSDVDAALYWAFRMLNGGEDPKYVFRRLIRFASEDIGVADNKALEFAIKCFQSHEVIGLPESEVILAQLIVYLASAEKNNKVYVAVNKVKQTIRETGNLDVPIHLKNAETSFLKDQGWGKDYKYYHDLSDEEKKSFKQEHLPEELRDVKFFD
ncbi:replication-associated recombination protein A [Candidatus Woesearchaeota archaeon]|jgi:putative ATPase|nr:replication-associated recombination protein A [Candidatus Woesearchaeota archaeon]MBT4110905.1 replication-associated recombination protein A [Candidatus Woesearchaeota archaeon]MBT4336583.1 replication-associated recombination protein A [Candidatus Woesearchaeota archaeon]MBT4469668.1 replication-associated recombination protein A [Candidatus Woesearchaeota archaeon]MBT6744030.1 replication-associated recombination protein A [Candidatus Woesearchaeota archaeon]